VLQLEAVQMLEAYCYSSVVVVIVLVTYFPLPCYDQTKRLARKIIEI
jgi:hypothetical protein